GSRENRSYYGATSKIGNEYDLTAVTNAAKAIKKAEKRTGRQIPLVVAVKAKTSFIPAEFEKKADAILVGYSVNDRALIETALGQHNPSGRLPIASPKNMDAVEAQLEDVGEDMTPYRDSQGHVYTFGYGLNWKGVIKKR
ncbi:MAG: glycoside hydrolase family 3 C-terminal domain-containing protein, partial [Luteococcus sp.]|uniref:glycoside hydrolase family 3 C-terminal domain-containing protein n=1 Tax=Luteococcus sp. TaxID=1969402 RepID=UPI00264815F5